MKKKLGLIFLSLLLAVGCANQLRSLNGQTVKSSAALEISDLQNDYSINGNIPIPTSVLATQGNYSDRIRVSWQQVFYGDATIHYHIYREEKKRDGEGNTLIRLTGYRPISNLYYDDLVAGTVIPGTVYRYYVRAVNMSSVKSEGSMLCSPVSGYALSSVASISADFRASTEKVTVTWRPVDGASFYYLYRAQERYENVVPNESSFERISHAFTTTTYDDYGIANGGSLESGKSYYYFVQACFDHETVSPRSVFARGALLAAGAPAEGELETVSNGEIMNAIRLSWKKEDSATEYRVYRLTRANLDSGDYVGTEMSIPVSEVKSDGSENVCWYDKSEAVSSGETFYYRVAAVNDYGAGSLSSPTLSEDLSERSRISGKAIPSAEKDTPYAMLMKNGFYVSWPSCFTVGNDAGYYLFSADGSSGSAPSADSNWTLLKQEPIKALEVTLSESDLAAVLNGSGIADAKLFFRVLPVNTRLAKWDASSSTVVNSGVEGSNFDKYRGELGEQDRDVYFVGRSNFTRPLYFEKKVPVLTSIKATEGTEIGTVKVTADLDLNSEIGYLYDIYLQRVCYYGDEANVYPLSLPPANKEPSAYFPLQGQAKKANTVTYPMHDSFKSGKIEWNDPMPDFDRNGKQAGTVTWDYATWDREAWKCILRKKDVDMRQFMKIEYKLIAIDLMNNNTSSELNTTAAVGWPDLKDIEFAHLSKWMTDCALNTIWQLNIPRMCWDNTVSWLPNLSFSHNGEKGGKMVFNVGSVLNLSGSGGSSGTVYSDWNGYGIKLSMSMAVTLDSMKPQSVSMNGIQITTPLFSGTMDMTITVRDFGPFWGLWSESDGRYTKGGKVKVKLGKRAAAEFDPSEVMMIGTGGKDVFNYKIHGYDFARDLDPAEKSTYPEAGGESWHYTRINWPARPYPTNNSMIKNKGNQAAINYGTTPW